MSIRDELFYRTFYNINIHKRSRFQTISSDVLTNAIRGFANNFQNSFQFVRVHYSLSYTIFARRIEEREYTVAVADAAAAPPSPPQ